MGVLPSALSRDFVFRIYPTNHPQSASLNDLQFVSEHRIHVKVAISSFCSRPLQQLGRLFENMTAHDSEKRVQSLVDVENQLL